MKKTNKNMKVGISLGMCFGVAIGTTWGESVSGSSGMGLALGLCAGMLIGMGLGAIKDNAVNKQLEEQFYIIKDIKNSPETNGFSVLIVNKRGEEQTVIVS